jgi:hypothetical protein
MTAQPPLPESAPRVALDGFFMQLRRSELGEVAEGLSQIDGTSVGSLSDLADALQQFPVRDRAPAWELAVRRYGHRKPLEQAAGEIGLDAIHGRQLLASLKEQLTVAPTAGPVDRESSMAAHLMGSELLGNAIAHHESVDLDAAHEASLEAIDDLKAER